MFLQNYVHRYIAKIYTNTQAWWLHFWDELFSLSLSLSLSIQVYTGLFEYNPHFRQIKGKLLDAHICILSRLTTFVKKKKKKVQKHTWKFKSRLSQSNTMWSQLKEHRWRWQPYWSNHVFGIVGHSTLFRKKKKISSLKSIKADDETKKKEYSHREDDFMTQPVQFLYGLCPSISEYLTTPEEI